jgi:hypothetical protein
MDGVGLRQVVEILGTTPEVLFRITGIAQRELPSLVQQDRLTNTLSLDCTTQQGNRQQQQESFHHFFIWV